MNLADYKTHVHKEVTKRAPPDQMRTWAQEWEATLRGLRASTSPFEHVSIVVARLEFLGGLLRGTWRTDNKDVQDYIQEFLAPYAKHINLVGKTNQDSELFSMLRNKPLHGYIPAPPYDPSSQTVVPWVIDAGGNSAAHHFARQASGTFPFTVDCKTLEDDFIQSLEAFAIYLATDSVSSPVGIRGTKKPPQQNLWVSQGGSGRSASA